MLSRKIVLKPIFFWPCQLENLDDSLQHCQHCRALLISIIHVTQPGPFFWVWENQTDMLPVFLAVLWIGSRLKNFKTKNVQLSNAKVTGYTPAALQKTCSSSKPDFSSFFSFSGAFVAFLDTYLIYPG